MITATDTYNALRPWTAPAEAWYIEPTEMGIATVWYHGYMFAMHIEVRGYVIGVDDNPYGVTSNTSWEWQVIRREDGREMGNFELKHVSDDFANYFTESLDGLPIPEWELDKPYTSLRHMFQAFMASDPARRATFHRSEAWCAKMDKAVFGL